MIRNYWKKFLEKAKKDENAKYAGVICFGMDAETCKNAVERILAGEMRCRIYPRDGYRKAMSGEAKVGELNIVVDWDGVPQAVIETTDVRELRFSQLTDDICALEGIQNNLSDWREKQMKFIKTEVEELGGEFDDSTPLTIEEFKTIYVNG